MALFPLIAYQFLFGQVPAYKNSSYNIVCKNRNLLWANPCLNSCVRCCFSQLPVTVSFACPHPSYTISLLEHKLLQAEDRRNMGSLSPLVGHTGQSWSFLGTCLGQKIIEIQRDSGTGTEPHALPMSRDLRPLCQQWLIKCAVCCLFWMLSFCTEILCIEVPGALRLLLRMDFLIFIFAANLVLRCHEQHLNLRQHGL